MQPCLRLAIAVERARHRTVLFSCLSISDLETLAESSANAKKNQSIENRLHQ